MPHNTFKKNKTGTWRMSLDNSTPFNIPHYTGLLYIQFLLKNQNESISAAELHSMSSPNNSSNPAKITNSSKANTPDENQKIDDNQEKKTKDLVARNIKNAISHLHKKQPTLGTHLKENISTGMNCSYAPKLIVNWCF